MSWNRKYSPSSSGTASEPAILNFSRPDAAIRRSVFVRIPYEFLTRTVQELLIRAAAEVPGVLRHPEPTVVTHAFVDYGVEYWLRYFIDDFERREQMDGTVRDRIHVALRRAGIPIATPSHRVQVRSQTDESEEAERARQELNGAMLLGRPIRIQTAEPRRGESDPFLPLVTPPSGLPVPEPPASGPAPVVQAAAASGPAATAAAPRRRLGRIAAIVLVDSAFFAVLSPLLPDYAARLDLSKTATGLLAGAFAAGVLVAALPSGLLASRLGLRTSLLLGLGLTAATSILFGLADRWSLLVATRFAAGVGSACSWTAALGWLARTAPPERRST